MSTLVFPYQEKNYKKPFHRRNDSDELDVFEASNYFSSTNEVFGYKDTNLAQKNIREEKQGSRGGRISLDMSLMRNSIPPQSQKKETNSKGKKNKPPSSPGGKLASFLNSLFNQTSSKKKMSKSMSHSMRDKDENSGGRKRRSSISHFESSFSKDSKFSTSSTGGFRTPPPYVNADPRIRAYNKWNSSYSDIGAPYVIKPSSLQNEVNTIEEFKFITNGTLEKPMKNKRIYEKNKVGKEIKRFDEVDDGGESDSSSDLFELENYGFGYCSSELPVYETTHMNNINIKRGPPISNGAV